MAGVVIVAAVVSVGPARPSVTASVKTFLLDWETGNYVGAAAMTTGNQTAVARQLQATSAQLGAAGLTLGMGPITVRGSQAQAFFNASIDLGRGGLSWHYQGKLAVRRTAAGWLVVWSPSVIAPGLGAGDRLAVLTKVPPRAALLDSSSKPLIRLSHAIELGVFPHRVSSPAATARDLARATHLPASYADEMSGYILAAPPQSFLELLQLSPVGYHRMARALSKVPDLKHRTVTKRLFDSTVPTVTGQVGTEIAKMLVQDGEQYLPGTTVGLSGLEQAYQGQLAGTPTTEVVVQNAKTGRLVKVLKVVSQGKDGTAVSTTIDAQIQQAAKNALAGLGFSASIVAVRAGGGQILAVAQHTPRGKFPVSPLTGEYKPGQSFTIVSTAALLDSGSIETSRRLPCLSPNRIAGQTFTNVPPAPGLGRQPTFSVVFAHACSTAFAALSLDLSARQLNDAATRFGIGVPWQLPLAAFTGVMKNPGSDQRELAADAIGAGSVEVSPLDMALVAGVAQSGSWHAPLLVVGQHEPRPASAGTFTSQDISDLRSLMRATVKSGVARTASLPGPALFGQVGTAPVAGHPGLRAIWFVGYRGTVAFAAVAFSRAGGFEPAVLIARRFAAALSAGS